MANIGLPKTTPSSLLANKRRWKRDANFEWDIEDIVGAHPNLYLEHCAVMAVALMSRQSASPLEFLVECEGFCPAELQVEPSFLLPVGWSERTAAAVAKVWVTEQGKPIVERAAVALAALAIGHLHPGSQMQVTEVGAADQPKDRRS